MPGSWSPDSQPGAPPGIPGAGGALCSEYPGHVAWAGGGGEGGGGGWGRWEAPKVEPDPENPSPLPVTVKVEKAL